MSHEDPGAEVQSNSMLQHTARGLYCAAGERASLYTKYTFGVWRDLVADQADEIRTGQIVKPGLVFEIAFEGMQRSNRHKSGVAVRFPRSARMRHDKTVKGADSIDTIRCLLGGGAAR